MVQCFDATEFYRHMLISHQRPMYDVQGAIAAPWIDVGFTYQAAFTETGELVLSYPRPPQAEEAPTDPVLPPISRASTASERML